MSLEFDDALIAAIYDEDNPDGPDHDWFRSLADELDARRIVGVGCGTGILTVTFAGPSRTVAGIDPAGAMLDVARSRVGGDAVTWIHGTSELLADRSADLVVMCGNVAMHLIGDVWHQALADISRALVPGGVLAFETRNPAAEAWREWNDPGSERRTAAGRTRETVRTSAPDAEGVVTMASTTDFFDHGRRISGDMRLQFRALDTLASDLCAVGLQIDDVVSTWTGDPFTGGRDERLMIVRASTTSTN